MPPAPKPEIPQMWLNLIMHKGIRAPGYRRGILRAEADSYANPIPSFRFWSFRKNKYHSWNIETGFLCRDGARVTWFSARGIQQLDFWTRKIQANARLLPCPAPRRVHFARPWTQASKSTLTDFSLAAKRRAEALHVVFF